MVILILMVHLYNFQNAQVGINQIMNSFTGEMMHFGHDVVDETANTMLGM